MSQEDIRQLRGEARQFTRTTRRELRGLLRGENIDPRQLDQIMEALRKLEDDASTRTPPSCSGCRRSSAKG